MKESKKKTARVASPGVRRSIRKNERESHNNRNNHRPIGAVKAQRLAMVYCLFHYPTLYTGGPPKRSPLSDNRAWVVPIILSSPSHGVMGQVGELKIDAYTGEVIAGTDRSEVVAAGSRLYQRMTDAHPSSVRPRKR